MYLWGWLTHSREGRPIAEAKHFIPHLSSPEVCHTTMSGTVAIVAVCLTERLVHEHSDGVSAGEGWSSRLGQSGGRTRRTPASLVDVDQDDRLADRLR